ncbi:hypothetical protein WG66_007498 [Moniliophthora roreri]|nr:hypothetical protein WG66_007498 [Moniliophthora roreri]
MSRLVMSHASELHNLTSDSDSIMLHLPSHEVYFTGTSIFMGSCLITGIIMNGRTQCRLMGGWCQISLLFLIKGI